MEKKIINPWEWQKELGFVQANSISGMQRLIFCAGQVSVDSEGRPLYPGEWRPAEPGPEQPGNSFKKAVQNWPMLCG